MLEFFLKVTTYRAALRIMTPILLAALGGAFSHYAGILNIALEGQMLMSAFISVAASYYFGSALWGVVAGMACGIVVGLLFGLFVITFKADEFIVGTAINILAVGGTTFLMRAWFNVKASFADPGIVPLPEINIPFLSNSSVLGELINGQSSLVYLSWILVIVLYVLFYHTPFGFHLRATGEHPEAFAAAGGNVAAIRYIASISCGAMCGLAGTHLALGYLTQFVLNMTAGRGFIALSATIFGNGNPLIVALASFLFALAESFSIRFQSLGIPPYFVLMIPYVFTIIALVFISARRKTNELME